MPAGGACPGFRLEPVGWRASHKPPGTDGSGERFPSGYGDSFRSTRRAACDQGTCSGIAGVDPALHTTERAGSVTLPFSRSRPGWRYFADCLDCTSYLARSTMFAHCVQYSVSAPRLLTPLAVFTLFSSAR